VIEAEEELKVRIIELSGRVMLEKSFTRK